MEAVDVELEISSGDAGMYVVAARRSQPSRPSHRTPFIRGST
jgi:hypothetical protein